MRNAEYKTHIRLEKLHSGGEVSYRNRVYLTRNGHGSCAIIDMQELDELDKQKALNQLLLKLQEAEKSVIAEGTISADELEKELGVS